MRELGEPKWLVVRLYHTAATRGPNSDGRGDLGGNNWARNGEESENGGWRGRTLEPSVGVAGTSRRKLDSLAPAGGRRDRPDVAEYPRIPRAQPCRVERIEDSEPSPLVPPTTRPSSRDGRPSRPSSPQTPAPPTLSPSPDRGKVPREPERRSPIPEPHGRALLPNRSATAFAGSSRSSTLFIGSLPDNLSREKVNHQ